MVFLNGLLSILVGGFKMFQTCLDFSIIYGMSSFPLTFIFFRGVGLKHQPVYDGQYYNIYILIYIYIHMIIPPIQLMDSILIVV